MVEEIIEFGIDLQSIHCVLYSPECLLVFGAFLLLMKGDLKFMKMAAELAQRGIGWVNPNPLVGAVIVKDGRIIGEGWHKRFGELHAERNALASSQESPEGATMYVTLEPCCHYGKTPPCTDTIIKNGISRVVIGLKDPNPNVDGEGIAVLRDNGIQVECGLMEDYFKHQNRVFLKYITTGKPWVVMKYAMTLDGKIASHTGSSNWISSEESRTFVHSLRSEFMSVMVGAGTVRLDNPMLNCRVGGDVRQPVRIILSSRGDLPSDCTLVRTAKDYPLIVAHTEDASRDNLQRLENAGADTLLCSTAEGGKMIDIEDLLKKVGGLGIDSILLEGGGNLNYSFVETGVIDEVYAFIAPKIIGGAEAKTPVEGVGRDLITDALCFSSVNTFMIGNDMVINALK